MARWRAEALRCLPRFRREIQQAETMMGLWTELWLIFCSAYRSEPRDERTIAEIYAFADWCVTAPRNEKAERDPLTCVVIGFYEDIPTFEPARDDMPRWFTAGEVLQNKDAFSYLLGERKYSELLKFMSENRRRYVPRVSTEVKGRK